MPNMVGKMPGKDQLIELLAKRGMADIYEAYQLNLEHYVTIYVHQSYLVVDRDFQARFNQEAKAVTSFRHPRVQ